MPTSKDFQGETGLRGSAANFFLAQERQYKKEAAIAHGVRGPSRSDHLSGASLPTSKDFQGETEQRGSAANFLFFSAQECPVLMKYVVVMYLRRNYIRNGVERGVESGVECSETNMHFSPYSYVEDI